MSITPLAPINGTVVGLLYEQHKSYLTMPHAERVAYFADPAGRQEMKSAGYHPLPVAFSWQSSLPPGTEYTLKLATNAQLGGAATVTTTDCRIVLDNLLIGTKYYWQVTAESAGQTFSSARVDFETEAQAPRLLRIDEVPNVRDLGGWMGLDGRRVRQGMLYRTAAVNLGGGRIFYSREELESGERPHPVGEGVRRTEAAMQRQIEQLRQRLQQGKEAEFVGSNLGPEWKVFRPKRTVFESVDYQTELDRLTAIPTTLMGAAMETVKTDSKGLFSFEEIIPDAPAVFMQEFEAEEDGYLQLGCGADYYWGLRLNGTRVFDRQTGNGTSMVSADNFTVQLPVRKGRNLMVAHVFSGAAGWAWCCIDRSDLQQPDGKTIIRQMIAELEEAQEIIWHVPQGYSSASDSLSQSTLAYFNNELGIRSDIDLRFEAECWGMTGSPLGKDVKWFERPFSSYDGMQTKSGRKAFVDTFRILLEEDNYPAIFHCAAGQDRTGALAFILNGLLGVEEDNLYLDWESTGFWNDDIDFTHARRFDRLVGVFTAYPGDTMADKVENYALDSGLTRREIERFREIMLE